MHRWKWVALVALVVTLVACHRSPANGRARRAARAPDPVAPQVCMGSDHTCFLQASGKVFCAGSNVDGELGDGTARDRWTFVPVVGITDATQLACGTSHTCVRRQSGQVSCWGRNAAGELGNGGDAATLVPVAVTGVNDAAEIAAGREFTCVRRTSGAVACFGSGDGGRLGTGNTNDSKTPVAVLGVSGALEIAAGRAHACARTNAGVLCWGENQSGQLGRGAGQTSNSPTPGLVAGLGPATGIEAGGNNTCAIVAGGLVSCWGGNYQGQLGNGEAGNTLKAETPTAVTGLSAVTDLALSENRACAIAAGGGVKCWGYNNYTAALLAVGSDAQNVPTPTSVTGVTGAEVLASGYQSSCAITHAGALVCWGQNAHGQHGVDSRASAHEGRVSVPAIATYSAPASQLDAFPATTGASGVLAHLALTQGGACGVTADGKVHCFGNGGDGILGNGSTRPVPASGFATTVSGITDAIQVASNSSRVCAVRANGKVACWGEIEAGLRSSLPVPVAGIDDAVEIRLGYAFACVRHRDGGVSCWGANNASQLGGASGAMHATPSRVVAVTGATRLACAGSTACAIVEGGSVVCWGANHHGELGRDAPEPSTPLPRPVTGIVGATDLAADAYDVCAVAGGSVYCWGENDDGQIGNGQASRDAKIAAPFRVRSVRDAVAVAVGGGTTCAVDRAGEAMCWGANDFGQTGHDNADVDDVVSPTSVLRNADAAVAAFAPYASMACANGWCCGVHRDGHQSCSGSAPIGGSSGLLGMSNVHSQHPVAATGVLWPATPAP